MRAFGSAIPNLQYGVLTQLLLDIEVPLLNVRIGNVGYSPADADPLNGGAVGQIPAERLRKNTVRQLRKRIAQRSQNRRGGESNWRGGWRRRPCVIGEICQSVSGPQHNARQYPVCQPDTRREEVVVR